MNSHILNYNKVIQNVYIIVIKETKSSSERFKFTGGIFNSSITFWKLIKTSKKRTASIALKNIEQATQWYSVICRFG